MKLAGIAFTDRGSRLLEQLLKEFQKAGEETAGAVSSSLSLIHIWTEPSRFY